MPAQEISQEVVERMAAFVRSVAVWSSECGRFTTLEAERETCAEARAIVALLPEPVDPDMVLARQVAADAMVAGSFSSGFLNAIRVGADDSNIGVICALAGIKAAHRQLAQEQSS